MLSPQRRSKITDIFMQQRKYKLHLEKILSIGKSSTPRSKRYEAEGQERILSQLTNSKKEVKERLSSNMLASNRKLYARLVNLSQRSSTSPQERSLEERHHNSYFTSRREKSRILQQNSDLLTRIKQPSRGTLAAKKLSMEYLKSRKLAANCRKFPMISQYEGEYRKKLSQALIEKVIETESHRKPLVG